MLSVPRSCSFSIIIKDLACGEDYSCLLTESGHVYSMGNNQYGKLGIKNNANQPFSNTPKLIDSLINYDIIKVACGWNHTAAIT